MCLCVLKLFLHSSCLRARTRDLSYCTIGFSFSNIMFLLRQECYRKIFGQDCTSVNLGRYSSPCCLQYNLFLMAYAIHVFIGVGYSSLKQSFLLKRHFKNRNKNSAIFFTKHSIVIQNEQAHPPFIVFLLKLC